MNPKARAYLNGRGISDEVIEKYQIDGDEEKIIMPIRGFNKYRTYPEKRYFYDKGFSAALFGVVQLVDKWCVLTEGEMDTLRLASVGIPAVSGTGGAGTFKDDWVQELPPIVFICYDTDKAGKENAVKIHWKIPNSRIVNLPDDVKDVTEYFETYTADDFKKLIQNSHIEIKPLPVFQTRVVKRRSGTDIEQARQYPMTELLKFRQNKTKCIWHNEKDASLHLYPNNTVYCFGCSRSGDAIDVYMTLNNCSFKQAIERLL